MLIARKLHCHVTCQAVTGHLQRPWSGSPQHITGAKWILVYNQRLEVITFLVCSEITTLIAWLWNAGNFLPSLCYNANNKLPSLHLCLQLPHFHEYQTLLFCISVVLSSRALVTENMHFMCLIRNYKTVLPAVLSLGFQLNMLTPSLL